MDLNQDEIDFMLLIVRNIETPDKTNRYNTYDELILPHYASKRDIAAYDSLMKKELIKESVDTYYDTYYNEETTREFIILTFAGLWTIFKYRNRIGKTERA